MVLRNGRRILVALLSGTSLLAAPEVPVAATSAARAAEADSLHRRAVARLAEGSLDARRLAVAELERASLLDPGRLQIWLDLGRLCLETGRRQHGRACYERARRVAPDDPEAHIALGIAWTWEWLSSFEESPLTRAQQSLARATDLAPGRADPWSQLSALELARGRVDRATLAAQRGLAADPRAWAPMVALACASYRAGALIRADSAFRVARERLPKELAWRFDDAIWSRDSDEGEPGSPSAPARGAAAGWRGSDPDLTTPENEAELDYLTRLGLALLLFRDARGLHWDMRAELFVRYGPPASVEVNPLSSPLAFQYRRYETEKSAGAVSYTPPPLGHSYNVQAWSYPELGIRAELWVARSRSRSGFRWRSNPMPTRGLIPPCSPPVPTSYPWAEVVECTARCLPDRVRSRRGGRSRASPPTEAPCSWRTWPPRASPPTRFKARGRWSHPTVACSREVPVRSRPRPATRPGGGSPTSRSPPRPATIEWTSR